MEYLKLFERLNEKLRENNLTLDVHCVGGFVLQYHGLKATDDIDAFYNSSDKVEELIQEVGEEFGVNTVHEKWLNNSIGKILTNSRDMNEIVYQGDNLIVYVSSLENVLIDKIEAGRAKDVNDISQIIKKLNFNSLDFLLDIWKNTDSMTDLGIILEAYTNAFGEESLKSELESKPDLWRYLK